MNFGAIQFPLICGLILISAKLGVAINFAKEDQPPWYHAAWPYTHPSQMQSHQLLAYMAENVYRNRPRLTPESQADSGNPQKISLDLFVAGIPSVDEIDQSLKVTLNLRAIWEDWRIVFSRYNSNLDFLNIHYLDIIFQEISATETDFLNPLPNLAKFWKPDLYIVNERGALRIENTEPNIMMRIYSNGTVIASQKLVMKVQCEMKFHRFPLDQQNCPLYFSSSNYPASKLMYEWNEEVGQPAVTLADQLTLPEFTVTGVKYKSSCDYDNSIPELANFTCLQATIHMERLFAYYFIEVYVPSMMVVALSWMNFWIDIEAIPARISLGLLTVLTTATQRSGIVLRTPKVSYTKAVDIWMTFCLIMVVAAMVEYSLVNAMAHKAKMGKELLSRFMAVEESESEEEDEIPGSAILKKEVVVRGRRRSSIAPEQLRQLGFCAQLMYRIRRTFKRLKTNRAYAVDVLSRIIFPTIFIIFNFVYWFTYLVIFTENPE